MGESFWAARGVATTRMQMDNRTTDAAWSLVFILWLGRENIALRGRRRGRFHDGGSRRAAEFAERRKERAGLKDQRYSEE